jgi:hypothetical protein
MSNRARDNAPDAKTSQWADSLEKGTIRLEPDLVEREKQLKWILQHTAKANAKANAKRAKAKKAKRATKAKARASALQEMSHAQLVAEAIKLGCHSKKKWDAWKKKELLAAIHNNERARRERREMRKTQRRARTKAE